MQGMGERNTLRLKNDYVFKAVFGADQLEHGDNYDKMKKVVSISIVDGIRQEGADRDACGKVMQQKRGQFCLQFYEGTRIQWLHPLLGTAERAWSALSGCLIQKIGRGL